MPNTKKHTTKNYSGPANPHSLKKGSLLSDFVSFLAKPDYDRHEDRKRSLGKLHDLFRLWALGMVVSGVLGVAASQVIGLAGYDTTQNTVLDLFFDQPLYVIMFLAFVWAPFTEEFTFRLGLKYSPYRLAFTASFVLLILFTFLSENIPEVRSWLAGSLENVGTFWRLAIYLGLVGLLGLLLGKWWSVRLPHTRVERFYRAHFGWIFYFSVIVFGVVHIFNYYNLDQYWYLFPLLVLPQMVFGAVFAYIRVIYGMVWAIFAHFFHNAVFSVPVLVLSFLPSRVLEGVNQGTPQALEGLTGDQRLLISVFSLSVLLLAVAVLTAFVHLLVEYERSQRANRA